jgi:hypothetical protein
MSKSTKESSFSIFFFLSLLLVNQRVRFGDVFVRHEHRARFLLVLCNRSMNALPPPFHPVECFAIFIASAHDSCVMAASANNSDASEPLSNFSLAFWLILSNCSNFSASDSLFAFALCLLLRLFFAVPCPDDFIPEAPKLLVLLS